MVYTANSMPSATCGGAAVARDVVTRSVALVEHARAAGGARGSDGSGARGEGREMAAVERARREAGRPRFGQQRRDRAMARRANRPTRAWSLGCVVRAPWRHGRNIPTRRWWHALVERAGLPAAQYPEAAETARRWTREWGTPRRADSAMISDVDTSAGLAHRQRIEQFLARGVSSTSRVPTSTSRRSRQWRASVTV